MKTTVAIIASVLLLPWLAHGQFLLDPYRYACAPLTAQTAVFDGVSDFIRINAGLAAVADGKMVTISFWVDFNGGDGAQQTIMMISTGGTSPLFWVSRDTGNQIKVEAWNSSAVQILSGAATTSTVVAASGWVHVYITFDLADTAKRHIYLNGSESAVTWATYTDDVIDLVPATSPRNTIGANRINTTLLDGALAELWFNDDYFNDPTKFRCGTHPFSLGSTGQTPTGSAPSVYLSLNGSGDSWATDSSGNGNTFTVTGALGSTTSP